MKGITMLTIFIGDIISLFPITYLKDSKLGVLLTVFLFGLTLILCQNLEDNSNFKEDAER